MSTVLDYYGQYNPQSNFDWSGLKSSKFGGTRKYFSPRDTIRSSLQMPRFQIQSGRKHYQEQKSPEHTFRSSAKRISMKHWHPRQSSKKMISFQLTKPHPRRQKRHLSPLNLQNDKFGGLRTFYNLGMKIQPKQFTVQDKMQRKIRVDQNDVRRTQFANQWQQMNYSMEQY